MAQARTLRGHFWGAFKADVLDLPFTDFLSIKYRNILKAASAEAGFPYRTVVIAIDVYSSRCESSNHHAGFEQLVRKGGFIGMARRIHADLKDIKTSTPRSR